MSCRPHILVVVTFPVEASSSERCRVSQLVDIEATFYARKKRGRKRLVEVFATRVAKVLPGALPVDQHVSPVNDRPTDGMEAEKVSNVALDKEIAGEDHSVVSVHCQNKSHAEAVTPSAQKRKVVCRDLPEIFNAPTDADATGAVPEGDLIAQDEDDIEHATDAPLFARCPSLQATCNLDVISQ